jgi:hypothetical protein
VHQVKIVHQAQKKRKEKRRRRKKKDATKKKKKVFPSVFFLLMEAMTRGRILLKREGMIRINKHH